MSRSPFPKLLIKLTLFLSFVFFLYLIANYFFLKWRTYNQVKKFLQQTSTQIAIDLRYKNKKWDTSYYLSDTELPYDITSYIFTSDGFIIDRAAPISGFLDTSDFNYINSFTDFQTYTSPINELWRLYSTPIVRENKTQGSILVSIFSPQLAAVNELDERLKTNAELINSMIGYKDDELDLSKFNIKQIGFDISYLIVDSFNNVLAEDGGPPAYIDRSYVSKALNIKNFQIIKDELTKENFLIVNKPILENQDKPIGVVVVGQSIKPIENILKNQIFFSVVSGLFVLITIFLLGVYLFREEFSLAVSSKAKALTNSILEKQKPKFINPGSIKFDKAKNSILLDSEKIIVPPDTNQFYFCQTLFSQPKRKWENDELLEKMGIDPDEKNSRAVYDAYFVLNKKTKTKINNNLFVCSGRTYFINPNYLSKVTKT